MINAIEENIQKLVLYVINFSGIEDKTKFCIKTNEIRRQITKSQYII